ncbi:MAG TPA: hypothetical protein VH796_16150 [Nitrososphaeraceae archaeon]|jgi:hypothetical protein
MVEGIAIGFSDMLSIAQTIGIVGTMVLTLFFSKKQIQSLSIDTQTRGLNDLGEKYLKMVERAIEDPSIRRVIDSETNVSQEGAYSFYILWICSHAYAMHKRNILDDNEWAGWVQWMRHIFRRGTIKETWRQIETDKWFSPDFQNFIDTEIIFGAKLT